MAMKKFFVYKKYFVLLLCALFLFCSGCAKTKKEESFLAGELTEYENLNETPKEGGTLRLALIGSKSLNPVFAENTNNLSVLKLLYDGLFRVTANNIAEPILCDEFKLSTDGLTYEFKIKSGISFHNGSPLTAEDVNETFGFLLQNETMYKTRFSDVVSHGFNGMTFYINLKRPVINFTALLDFPVLSKSDLLTEAAFFVPNGTGRFKVQSYKVGKELYLTVNQNYHREFSPYIDEILVKIVKDNVTAISMLENLQIDLLSSDIVDLYSYTPKRNLASLEYSNGSFAFLGMNNQHPALLSEKTRKAIASCIDRTKLLTETSVKHAEAAVLPFPQDSFWNSGEETITTLSKEESRQLFFDDGWSDSDGDGVLDKEIYGEKVDLQLSVLVNEENHTRLKCATLISQMLSDVGVISSVLALPFDEYNSKVMNREYDLMMGETIFSPNYDLSFLLKTDENFLGIANERFDQTFNALGLMEGNAQKQALYYELCQLISEAEPFVSLYFENDVIVFDSRLKGAIVPAKDEIFFSVENWFISERDD